MLSARVGLLKIDGLRNIEHTEVDLGGGRSLVVGANGSGKTSVLEAIYLLARGRSFRGRRCGDLTSIGKEMTKVSADIREGCGDSVWGLSYVREKAVIQRYVRGILVGVGGDLVKWFVVRLIGDSSCRLFEGEPVVRRGFVDLNLFHVEQGGAELLRVFRRVLDQRNAWLRSGARGRPVWDQEFVRLGTYLDQMRRGLLSEVESDFSALSGAFDFLEKATLVFRSGWREGMDLADALASDASAELASGFTRVGPHRADFSLQSGARVLPMSRGQTKIAVCLLQLAFDRVQCRRLGFGSVWLLDDVGAELDNESCAILRSLFDASGGQCIYTIAGDRSSVAGARLPSDTRLFHVERGAVIALS